MKASATPLSQLTEDFFKKKKIIVCCGSGGVGKTTSSAALALMAARFGFKSIVLTIDPAKRLANAMGLSLLDNIPQKIKIDGIKGELYAMMLDTKRTFDRLIERHSEDEVSRNRILNNRLYQHMSNMIAGSQEYMAMERLHEIVKEGKYDVVVLDTPPTRHALDFLEAPQKMVRLTENSLLKWFLKPGFFAGRIGFGIFQKSTEKILSVFDRLAGLSFLRELAEMFSLMKDLLGGFSDRAKSVDALLHRKGTTFLLVTSPAQSSIKDALFFHQKIQENDLPFSGFIVNRVRSAVPKNADSLVEGLSKNIQTPVRDYLSHYQLLVEQDSRSVLLLKEMMDKKSYLIQVPLLNRDVHDLDGVLEVGKALLRS